MSVNYQIRPAIFRDAAVIASLYEQNRAALHGMPIPLADWQTALRDADPDEQHCLITQNNLPIAWVKINGLCSSDTVWLSMLAVAPCWQRHGVGRFAVSAFEAFGSSRNFRKFAMQTTADNIPARRLYTSCGYAETQQGERCQYSKTI